MATHKVTVWDRPQVVETYQRSKTVWVASGTYMDQSVEVTGRTESAAVKLWRETARYKGN